MKLLKAERPPERPEDAAIWWATRRQLDPARFAEDEAFPAWLADEANARAWEEIERRVDVVGAFATMPEVREMRRAALELARRPPKPARNKWFLGAAIAASLAGGFVWIAGTAEAPTGSIAVQDGTQRFATAVGERRDITLDDGSRVTLNTASLIEVAYSSDTRSVRLLQGQALFHVAQNLDRPFVVQAGGRQITALGTAFDVRLQPNGQVEVLLVEGHVRVDPVQRQGLARLIPALARTDLAPGQELVAPASGDIEVAQADVERETAWNRGLLIFRNDSVGDAVREVNRYSAVQLVVDDPRVAGLKVSGIFPSARREDFVAALEALYPVSAQPETAGTVRLRWRGDQPRQQN